MSDYENERYTPTFANFFKLKLKFDGRFLHIEGGKTPGSAGCIDLTASMPQFVQALKEETGLIKCFIELTVDYEVVL